MVRGGAERKQGLHNSTNNSIKIPTLRRRPYTTKQTNEMAMHEVEFEIMCDLPPEINKELLITNLPPRKTKILEAKYINDLIHLKIFTPYTTIEEVKQWINEFEEVSQTSYSVTTTKDVTGRYVEFKQYLHCHHKTRAKTLYDGSKNKNPTRNTDCPSTLSITLHAKKKRYQSKDKARNELFKEMRCEIDVILTHNHNVDLTFRKVSEEVKGKLIELYRQGHSPATALRTIKIEICMNYKNHEEILMDRMYCPDYKYCYYVYANEFKGKCTGLDVKMSEKDLVQKRLEDYNKEMKDNCAQLFLHGSDYIVCICPPFSKRVHQQCQSSSEIVLIESSKTCNRDGSRIYILLTHSEAGSLLLGVFITSRESTNIQIAFQLLKNMLGNTIFAGNFEGPKIFLTTDSRDEQDAINAVWPNSKCLLNSFHVLNSTKKWLMKTKNNIPPEQQYVYFNDFKMLLNSETLEECVRNYETARSTIIHGNYLSYFEEYWQKKELWVLCYRNSILTPEYNVNDVFETAMIVIKEETFNRVIAFNIVQLVNFILTQFVNYYEKQLLEAANNLQNERSRMVIMKSPPPALLQRILVLTDDNIIVPSESIVDLVYIVNLNALTCSCTVGITGEMCKHIHWAALVKPSPKYEMYLKDADAPNKFYYIATGRSNTCNILPVSSDNQVSMIKSVQDIKTEATIEERTKLISEEFDEIFTRYLEKSPKSVGAALEIMLKNMKKIKSVPEFIAACSNFASGYNRKNPQSVPTIQQTGIPQRKVAMKVRSRKNKVANPIVVKKLRRILSK